MANADASDPAATADAEPQRGEELLQHGKLEAQLRRLCRHHSLLMARCSGEAEARPTVVLSVDFTRRRLLIDALPGVPPPALPPGTVLKLRTRVGGAELLFSAPVDRPALFEAAPALALRFPEFMRLRERRGARRLPLPPALQLPPSQAEAADAVVGLQLIDISVQGAGALSELHPALRAGERMQLNIELPGTRVPVIAELRSCVRHGDRLRLGLQFTQLAPQELDRLAAAILRIERQLIRATQADL